MRFFAPLLALTSLAWLLARRAAQHVRAVNARSPAGTLLPLPAGPLHLLEAGSGQDVVLIHGSDGVVGDWALCGLLARLAGRARTLAYDRPGHGHTPVPGGETVDFALNVRMLRELLAARGAARPVLVGHSYGAGVALAYALTYPGEVAGLLLLAPTAYPHRSLANPVAYLLLVPGVRELILRVLLLPLGRLIVAYEGGRAFAPLPIPPAWRDMMLAYSLRPSQAKALGQENRSFARELSRLSSRYGELQTPVTIVSGRSDRLTPLRWQAAPLARALPCARLVTPERGSHEIHWSHPEVVWAELERLLS